MAHHSAHGDHHKTPFQQLKTLLKPELTDIAVVVIFSLVVGILSLATPIAVEALVNTVAFGRFLQPLIVLGIILLTFLGFAAVLRGLQAYVAEIIQRRIFVRVVADLAHRLPRVKLNAFDGHDGVELVNRYFDVMTVQKTAALLVLDGVGVVVTSLIGLIVLAFYHPFLLGFDIGLMAAIAFIVIVLGRGAVDTAIAESYKKYAIAAWLEQLADSPLAFRLGGARTLAVERADDLVVEYIQSRKSHFSIVLRQLGFSLGLQAFAATALLGLGGWLVINQQLTLGQLVAAELIVAVIVGSFAKLGKHLESFYDLLAAVDKLGYLLELPTERQSGEEVADSQVGAEVKLHEVALTDSSSPNSAAGRINLQVKSGEQIAIWGAPGSGKSKLLEMLFALREPAAGHIEINGVDVRSLNPESLRSTVSFVSGSEVIPGTIIDNVHLHRPDISAADVREALRRVGLWEELMHLPLGLETELSARGAPLSQSQIVRLVLARGIAGNPRLLLIDGTLDALPDSLLLPVFRALCGAEGERTIILVTGRTVLRDECPRSFQLGPNLTHDANEAGGSESATIPLQNMACNR